MKTEISAFQVEAKVSGKLWTGRCVTLTALCIDDARDKAINLLGLTSEHEITIEPVTVYGSGEKLETNDYPYGRERCTAYFSVEYNAGKGMRSVFQTVNPKTGRLNNPKKSTYYRALLPMKKENGHFDFCGWLDFNGSEAINIGLQFMADFHELFTPEQIKDIALVALAMSKINIKAMVIYAGSTFEDLKPLVEANVKMLSQIVKTGENLWADAMLNVKVIEATKKPGYNPFTVKAVQVL